MQSLSAGTRAQPAGPLGRGHRKACRPVRPAHASGVLGTQAICQCSPSDSPQQQSSTILCSRRQLTLLSVVLPSLWANARSSEAVEAVAQPPAVVNPYANSGDKQELFIDDEYEYLPPAGFRYIEIAVPLKERGPAPERSPIRSRFEATGNNGTASVSVVVRNAQTLTFSLTQVVDISLLGTPEEAAKLLVPRGSRLLSATSQVVELPPRETPLGLMEIPPKSYYLYEFLTTQGDHIAMAAAASRGKVFVCGGAAPVQQWPNFAEQLVEAVKTFRLRV